MNQLYLPWERTDKVEELLRYEEEEGSGDAEISA